MSEIRSIAEAGFQAGGPPQGSSAIFHARRMADTLRAAGPPLLFGLRLWASVCLALYVAFWLELDNAYWAGTSAAIVCQPHLGASLRKGWFRMIGTVVGAVAIVALTACFPQDRAPFLVGLALWGAGCAFVATLLGNFAAYSAALAGFTAAIIANDQLGATGGPNGDAFTLAIMRVSEICIGIVCAGVVLVGTDFGGAPRRLAAMFATLAADIAGGFMRTLSLIGARPADTRNVRRELTRRVIALDPVIDEALGESSGLRYHLPVLQAATDGLFAALAGWRDVSAVLLRLPENQARQEAGAILRRLPQALQSATGDATPAGWTSDPIHLRQDCEVGARSELVLPAGTPSQRLLADQTAKVLIGISKTLNGMALLRGDPDVRLPLGGTRRFHVPDWLPAAVNGARAFATIGAMAIFWIVTEWPSGALAMAFAAIGVILFAPRAEQAYEVVMGFMAGTMLAASLAAIVAFAVLPGLETFVAFSIVIGLVLVPAGALMAQPWQTAIFTAIAANFLPLLAPANLMNYDTVQFYNSALAIVAGTSAAAISFRLLPPLPPVMRTRRLLAQTLRDLHRLATGPVPRTAEDWEARANARLVAMPDKATPLQRAQVLAALSVGTELIELRRSVPEIGRGPELDAALAALARGDGRSAAAQLARLDQLLALDPGESVSLRARGRILAISEALLQHAAFFGAGGSN